MVLNSLENMQFWQIAQSLIFGKKKRFEKEPYFYQS